jgi:hypothetical protein
MNNKVLIAARGITMLIVFLLPAVSAVGAQRSGPVVVPDNAYANGFSFGTGWECSFGYDDKDAICIAIDVPDNGYLNSRGNGWKCDRGYHLAGFASKECSEIKVPANAYLAESSSQSGWACNRGFKATRDACERILIPANAYPTNSSNGSGWECERGYRAMGESCVAISIPENAYLSERSYGPGWQCARGYYTADAKACRKLDVPEFAHLDNSGNSWECNRPYKQRGEACVII